MPTESEHELILKAVEEERKNLRSLPFIPYDLDADRRSVLLSDQIQYYRDRFKLIDPWDPTCLRPAGYDLRVGSNASIGGENKVLKDFESIRIGPYQVAVIETYETLNMPDFLIGRWNIRVALAYEGLLWVGGAQVDPGFRGHLACPIYNLSDKEVALAFRQPLAMLDFVTTTKVNRFSQRFDWENRRKIVFAQYKPDKLVSGITTKIEKRVDAFEEETTDSITAARKESQEALQRAQVRIDTFVGTILTVVTLLFAGLGVIATKSPEPSLTFTSLSLVSIAAIALYFALRPYYLSSKLHAQVGDSSSVPVGNEFLPLLRLSTLEKVIAAILVLASLAVDVWSMSKIQQTTAATSKTQEQRLQKADAERLALEKQLQDFRQQSDARATAIEKDVRSLQAGKKDK